LKERGLGVRGAPRDAKGDGTRRKPRAGTSKTEKGTAGKVRKRGCYQTTSRPVMDGRGKPTKSAGTGP